MKTLHDHSPLDNFLRDTLKTLDVQYQQSDWSDMESILGPEQKPMEVNINKKTILISAAALAVLIIVIIISKTVHFDHSSSKEISPENTNSSQNVLKAVDTQKTTVITNPGTPVIDSAKNNSPVPVKTNKIADSAKTISVTDTSSAQKINNTKNISQKTDKKKKEKTPENTPVVDSSSVKTTPEQPMDTLSKHPHQEITLPASADSSKKNKKDKKQKLKFFFRQKHDSLK